MPPNVRDRCGTTTIGTVPGMATILLYTRPQHGIRGGRELWGERRGKGRAVVASAMAARSFYDIIQPLAALTAAYDSTIIQSFQLAY